MCCSRWSLSSCPAPGLSWGCGSTGSVGQDLVLQVLGLRFSKREILVLHQRIKLLQSLKSTSQNLKPKVTLRGTWANMMNIGLLSFPNSPRFSACSFLSLKSVLVKSHAGVFLFTKLFLVLIVLARSALEKCLCVSVRGPANLPPWLDLEFSVEHARYGIAGVR